MAKYDWHSINNFIRKSLEENQDSLDQETIDFVNHYLQYDEYEMAFEGLFIELMDLGQSSNVDLEKSWEIGQELELHKYSIFDETFWVKFEIFARKPFQ
jgi:hypothetical protein